MPLDHYRRSGAGVRALNGGARLRRSVRVAAVSVLALGVAIGGLSFADSGAARAAAAAPAPTSASATALPGSFADLVERVKPAVVNIATTEKIDGQPHMGPGAPNMPFPPDSPMGEFFRRFFGPGATMGQARPREVHALGSGFIIDADGYVVTNNHVIDGADEITVILEGGARHEATLLGRDAKTDLALLKIDADAPLPHVEFGDSDAARVGDWVVAVGNPFGLGGSVTAGIISARGRDIHAGPFDDFLQVDAPINRGNSGGPLFDAQGRVIGINTAIYSPNGGNVGIGFATPSSLAKTVIAQLRDNGAVERGWLGVTIQSVTEDIADSLGLNEAEGALVSKVLPDSPAAEAGLQQGDVIVALDGQRIGKLKTLPRLVAEAETGKPATVTVWRDGREKDVTVTIGRMPEETASLMAAEAGGSADHASGRLGLAVAPMTPQTRQRFGIAADVDGVVVVDVAPDGTAAEKGLRPGDVIVAVGREKVSAPSDLARAVDAVAEDGRETVLLLVSRDGGERYIAVKLG